MLSLRSLIKPATSAAALVAGRIDVSYAKEVRWDYIESSGIVKSVEALKMREAISEKVIVFIGKDAEPSAANVDTCPVTAIDAASIEQADNHHIPSSGKNVGPKPVRVIWPDKDDRILAEKPDSLDGKSKTVARNPWQREGNSGLSSTKVEFSCGGIVIGGERGPIALLNGRIVRIGAEFAGFGVREIVQEGVILDFAASCYMVPKGKRAVITIAGN